VQEATSEHVGGIVISPEGCGVGKGVVNGVGNGVEVAVLVGAGVGFELVILHAAWSENIQGERLHVDIQSLRHSA